MIRRRRQLSAFFHAPILPFCALRQRFRWLARAAYASHIFADAITFTPRHGRCRRCRQQPPITLSRHAIYFATPRASARC